MNTGIQKNQTNRLDSQSVVAFSSSKLSRSLNDFFFHPTISQDLWHCLCPALGKSRAAPHLRPKSGDFHHKAHIARMATVVLAVRQNSENRVFYLHLLRSHETCFLVSGTLGTATGLLYLMLMFSELVHMLNATQLMGGGGSGMFRVGGMLRFCELARHVECYAQRMGLGWGGVGRKGGGC